VHDLYDIDVVTIEVLITQLQCVSECVTRLGTDYLGEVLIRTLNL